MPGTQGLLLRPSSFLDPLLETSDGRLLRLAQTHFPLSRRERGPCPVSEGGSFRRLSFRQLLRLAPEDTMQCRVALSSPPYSDSLDCDLDISLNLLKNQSLVRVECFLKILRSSNAIVSVHSFVYHPRVWSVEGDVHHEVSGWRLLRKELLHKLLTGIANSFTGGFKDSFHIRKLIYGYRTASSECTSSKWCILSCLNENRFRSGY